MDEGFLCEAVGSLVVVRLTRAMDERVLEECQLSILGAMQETGSKAVLYDLTGMQPTAVNVLLYQRLLNEHVHHLDIRRAIVAPNTQIAHLARLAFGVGDYKLFYDDHEAAMRFLRDASPFSNADWSLRVTEERRLRERRTSPRGGRRERDHVG
jgi:hypothetical protein